MASWWNQSYAPTPPFHPPPVCIFQAFPASEQIEIFDNRPSWNGLSDFFDHILLRKALRSISLSKIPCGSPEFDDSGFWV